MSSRLLPILVVAMGLLWTEARASAAGARQGNEENLAAIRSDIPQPPVHARNLFHVAVGMYNAWAAYDTVAIGYIHHERATAPRYEAAGVSCPQTSREVPRFSESSGHKSAPKRDGAW